MRALVESGTVYIDAYLAYGRDAGGDLVRYPVRDAVFERDGTRYALAWADVRGRPVAIDPAHVNGASLAPLFRSAASGDVAYHDGHFHPNKAPGTSFLAVPAYAVLRVVEGVLGVDPDRWSTLTTNAWLVSVLSVGLVSALGTVLVFRLARRLASERDAVLTALVFAFATMTWPHATLLFEHNVIAVALLAAWYCIDRAADVRAPDAADGGVARVAAATVDAAAERARVLLVCAGLAAGWAAMSNYAMAALVLVFFGYALARHGWRRTSWYALGVAVPLVVVCAYNQLSFGTPFTTNYAYENPVFLSERHRLLGLFAVPRIDVLLVLLFSPFRGLFFTSPVLLAGVAGTVLLLRRRTPPGWGVLIAVVAGFLLLLNASFNGWDAGWTAVPRYLGPAMPFLAVPIALAWRRWFWPTAALAIVSVAMQLLLVAVDPQVPIGGGGETGVRPVTVWRINPMTRYVLPLFVSRHPWPILDEQIGNAVTRAEQRWSAEGVPAADRERRATEYRNDLRARAERGDPSLLSFAGVVGPVSANPIGIYESGYYRVFPAGSREAAGNAFNAGELLFPGSRASLLPLLVVGGALAAWLIASASPAVTAASRRR